jgi:hypothetical protein
MKGDKTMKKIFTLTAMAVITCSLLIGCSNKNETSEESLGDIIIYDDYTSTETDQPEKDSESQNSEVSTEVKDTESTNTSEDTKEPDKSENSEEIKESEKSESTEESTKPDNGGITSDEPEQKADLLYVSFEYFKHDSEENVNYTYKIYVDENEKYTICRSKYLLDSGFFSDFTFEILEDEYYELMEKINELNWSSCENYKEEINEEGFEDNDYDNYLILQTNNGNTIKAMWENIAPMSFDKNWEMLDYPFNFLVGTYINKE